MNTKCLLPATFSLTFCTFLLFGMPGKTPRNPFSPENGVEPDRGKAIPIDPDEPAPASDENESAAPASPGSPVAERLPDIPVINPPPGVPTMPVMPSIPGDPKIGTIPVAWTTPRRVGGGSQTIVSFEDLDREPHARLRPAPVYPTDLRDRGIEGTVIVEFLVDESGNAYNAAVPGFDAAALRAVAKWRFEPGYKSGRRVRFRMSVPLVFRIVRE